MKEIQRKYKNNPEKLNQETIELYKREKGGRMIVVNDFLPPFSFSSVLAC